MTRTVDLNADMGESFGSWSLGDDTGLLDIVTSANIACGFHAGDPDVMAATMKNAVVKDVGIGAHPGFPDLQGFGRRRMSVSYGTLGNMVRYQGKVWNVEEVNLPGNGQEPYPNMRQMRIVRDGPEGHQAVTVRELEVDYIDEREADGD